MNNLRLLPRKEGCCLFFWGGDVLFFSFDGVGGVFQCRLRAFPLSWCITRGFPPKLERYFFVPVCPSKVANNEGCKFLRPLDLDVVPALAPLDHWSPLNELQRSPLKELQRAAGRGRSHEAPPPSLPMMARRRKRALAPDRPEILGLEKLAKRGAILAFKGAMVRFPSHFPFLEPPKVAIVSMETTSKLQLLKGKSRDP